LQDQAHKITANPKYKQLQEFSIFSIKLCAIPTKLPQIMGLQQPPSFSEGQVVPSPFENKHSVESSIRLSLKITTDFKNAFDKMTGF
jgi:hypothetical protein